MELVKKVTEIQKFDAQRVDEMFGDFRKGAEDNGLTMVIALDKDDVLDFGMINKLGPYALLGAIELIKAKLIEDASFIETEDSE